MTWPSARRTMYGASLNPESAYSPINSTPSASRGVSRPGASSGGGRRPTVALSVVVIPALMGKGGRHTAARPPLLEVVLADRRGLRCVGVRDRAVRENVRSDRGVDQRHRRALGQFLARERIELLTRQLLVLLTHVAPSLGCLRSKSVSPRGLFLRCCRRRCRWAARTSAGPAPRATSTSPHGRAAAQPSGHATLPRSAFPHARSAGSAPGDSSRSTPLRVRFRSVGRTR